MTWTSLNKFLINKTLPIWKCATWKMCFMHWSFISSEYEQDSMEMRFPSDFEFSRGGHFLRFLIYFLKIPIFEAKLFNLWKCYFLNFWKTLFFKTIQFFKYICILKMKSMFFENFDFSKKWLLDFSKFNIWLFHLIVLGNLNVFCNFESFLK